MRCFVGRTDAVLIQLDDGQSPLLRHDSRQGGGPVQVHRLARGICLLNSSPCLPRCLQFRLVLSLRRLEMRFRLRCPGSRRYEGGLDRTREVAQVVSLEGNDDGRARLQRRG